jgi:hypothetical protein
LAVERFGVDQSAGLMMRRRLREDLIGRWLETGTHVAG